MKKKILAFFIVIAFIFGVAACTIDNNDDTLDNNEIIGGDDDNDISNPENSGLPLSGNMFKNYMVNLEGAVSLGIIDQKPTKSSQAAPLSVQISLPLSDSQGDDDDQGEKKNYLVKVDDEDEIEEVIFYKEDENDENDEIKQEEIQGYVYKMHVYKNFVYISFTNLPESDINYNSNDFHITSYFCNNNYQSFVINIETGKVYSLSTFAYIEKIAGNIIFSGNDCYKMTVENDDLKFTALINNSNITVQGLFIDKFDRIFIINNSEDLKTSDAMYLKSSESFRYLLGSDGLMYKYAGTILKYFNQSGNLVDAENTNKAFISGPIPSGYLYPSIALIIRDGLAIEVTYFGLMVHAINTGSLDYFQVYFSQHDSSYIINGEVLFNVNNENGDRQLVHYKVNDMTMADFLNNTVPKTMLDVINASSLEIEDDTLVASVQKIGGTQKYRIWYDGTEMIVEPYAPIIYQTQIITIQPLN